MTRISEYVDNDGCLDDWKDEYKNKGFLYEIVDSGMIDDLFKESFSSVVNGKTEQEICEIEMLNKDIRDKTRKLK